MKIVNKLVLGGVSVLAVPVLSLAANDLKFGSVSPANGSKAAPLQPVLAAQIINSGSELDTQSVVMTFDGMSVVPSMVQSGPVTTVRYAVDKPLALGSAHTVRVTAAGGTGTCFTNEWSFSVTADIALDPVKVEEAIRRANDYFQKQHPIGNSGWERGTYQTGNFRAWQTLGVQAYYDRAVAWGNQNKWRHGTDYGDWNGNSADAHCCGQTYIDLYKVDPRTERIENITTLLNHILLNKRPDSVDDWWWIDAFYMAGSVLSRLSVVTSDTNYLSQLNLMYDYMKNTQGNGGLFNAANGLWWRDSNFKSSAPDVHWGRGNGWVMASLARNLEILPKEDTVCRPEFESMLKTMAAALLPWQQADGFWRADITHPDNARCSNPETSGTAFFTYAIAYGLNEGLLVDSPGTNYTAAVKKAWNGLSTVALHPDGKLGYIQAVGADPQPANYDSERDYGYGGFLLAGCEILRMLGGPVPVQVNAGGDLSLTDSDLDGKERAHLSVSRSVLRSGYMVGYSWWNGAVRLGSGKDLDVDFPLGTNTVTLRIVHSNGNTYSDTLTVKVAPPSPNILVAASGHQTGNTPENTLDENLDTRWSQEGADGSQWIQYELPQTSVLDHLGIAFSFGNSRQSRFAVWLSMDGTKFKRVLPDGEDSASYVVSSGGTLNFERVNFPAQAAKCVRIQGWGNSVNAWNSLAEVQIPVPALRKTDSGSVQ